MTDQSRAKLLDAATQVFGELAEAGVAPSLDAFDRLRATATPEDVARLDDPLRRCWLMPCEPLPWPDGARLLHRLTRPARRPLDAAFFAAMPRAALLLAHSRSGHVREAAVRAMPLDDAAALALLLLRCNDWVAQVRDAANARLQAHLPKLTADDLVPLCAFLLLRAPTWERGGAEAAGLLLGHPAATEALRRYFLIAVNGPLVRGLRMALRTDALDADLPALATAAKSGFVRSLATEVLLTGTARWPAGQTWRWIDKTVGKRQRVPLFETRPVAVDPAVWNRVLRAAAGDKSVKVRKLAVDTLIAHGPDGRPDLADLLRRDRAGPVAERMDFYDRKWGAPDAPEERKRHA